jgi:hypothetical protein
MHPQRVAPLIGTLAAVAAIIACDSAPGLGTIAGIGGASGSSMIVYGSTTSATRGPVVAALRVIAEDSTCSGASLAETDGTSSAGGGYRLVVKGPSASQPMCIVVTGVFAAAAETSTVIGAVVTFGAGESTQVNISFP